MIRWTRLFTIFTAAVVVQGLSGVAAWLLERQRWESPQYGALVRHVELTWLVIPGFLFLIKNHVHNIYGRLQGWGAVLVFLTVPVLAFVIGYPIWPLFVGLPILVAMGLSIGKWRSRIPVRPLSTITGVATGTIWWTFLFYSWAWYVMGEEFYITFGQLHVGLGILTFGVTGFHIAAAGSREPIAGYSPKRRFAALAIMVALVALGAWQTAAKAQQIFTPRPTLVREHMPIRINTADVAAGRVLSPDLAEYYVDSGGCNASGCHNEIYRQWSISSHRYAGTNAPYRKMIELVARERGLADTLLCAKCHTPMLAMLGIPDDPNDPSLNPYREAGINCQFCHSITDASPRRANGELALELRYDHFQDRTPTGYEGVEAQRDFIRHNLSRHRQVYPVRDPSKEEYCLACHRVIMPEEWVGERNLVLGDTHTAFSQSDAAMEGVSCSECHMALATYWTDEPGEGRDKHARPDHRMLGANNAMSLLIRPPTPIEPDIEELDRATEKFLDGSYDIPDYETTYLRLIGNKKYEGYVRYMQGVPKIGVALSAPETAVASTEVEAVVAVTNQTGAHVFPAGPLDFIQAWIEVVATDADGAIVFRSGALEADGALEPGTVAFGGVPLDKDGNPVLYHRFWQTHNVADKRVIPVGGVDTHAFRFAVSPEVKGPIRVKAALCVRRFNQPMADWFFDNDGTTFPIHRYDAPPVDIRIEGARS